MNVRRGEGASVSAAVALCEAIAWLCLALWSLGAIRSSYLALLTATSSSHLIHGVLQNGRGRPWPKGHGRQRMPLGLKAVEDR